MDVRAVYRKSDKGARAISSRAPEVGGKLRTLLILVDGKKNVEELKRLAAGLGQPDELLDQLFAEGLIELDSAVMPDPAQGHARAGASAADLSTAKALATRLLTELLGPSSDDLCIKIEGAKDMPQFIDAMKRAYSVMRDIKGQAVAERFGQSVENQLPAN